MAGARAPGGRRTSKPRGEPGPEKQEGCPECDALRAGLAEVRRERDAALLALAREREAFDALRLAFPPTHPAPLPPFQPAVLPPAPPPLRYVVVDRANAQLKRYLGPLHAVSRQVADAALQLLGRGK